MRRAPRRPPPRRPPSRCNTADISSSVCSDPFIKPPSAPARAIVTARCAAPVAPGPQSTISKPAASTPAASAAARMALRGPISSGWASRSLAMRGAACMAGASQGETSPRRGSAHRAPSRPRRTRAGRCGCCASAVGGGCASAVGRCCASAAGECCASAGGGYCTGTTCECTSAAGTRMLATAGLCAPCTAMGAPGCGSDIVLVPGQQAHRLGQRIAPEGVAQFTGAHDLDHAGLALVHLQVDGLLQRGGCVLQLVDHDALGAHGTGDAREVLVVEFAGNEAAVVEVDLVLLL